MIVKCINCKTLWDVKTEKEKCCENCKCQKECPNCGCNCYVPVNKKENNTINNTKEQLLLFD